MPSSEISIRLATENDSKAILDFELDVFIKAEPTCAALEITKDGAREFFTKEVTTCLKSPVSFLAVSDCGDIAGIILCAMKELAEKKEKSPLQIYERKRISQNAQVIIPNNLKPIDILGRYIESLESKYEAMIPSCNRQLLHVETLCVDVSRFGGQGLGKDLVRICLENAERLGYDGISASAISTASQNLFRKIGFSVLRQKKHEDIVDENGDRIIQCKDRTNQGQFVFKSCK